jgi:hypothetical protein
MGPERSDDGSSGDRDAGVRDRFPGKIFPKLAGALTPYLRHPKESGSKGGGFVGGLLDSS